MGLDPILNMLPPPNPLSLPAWFNPNELWSAEQPNPRANFSSAGRSEALYHQRASFASQNGALSSVDGRDSVESGITDQAGRSNAFGSDQLDKHLQSNAAPTGSWGGGSFHLQSLNGRQDEFSNIDSSSMRSLGIGLDNHHNQSVAAGAASTSTSIMHEWQQQQQLNPAGLVTGSAGPLSSSSGNSSISPFQLMSFACKPEPKSEQRDQWEEDAAAASMQKNSFIGLPGDHNNNNLSAMTRSNVTSASGEASVSSGSKEELDPTAAAPAGAAQPLNTGPSQPAAPVKKKRNLPGNPDPDAEVIALSPRTLLATNRFVCEICNKGFQRDQNLQLHRRGHNLPWKLKQRSSKEVVRKRVYICPESNCVHNDPARALGDLTGIKKHFCRKHGEKKWKCDKCSKRYAVQSDWKAHMKTCGTREYRCDCGTLFSRRDSFITHRAFCDALAEENSRISAHRQQVAAPEQINHAMLGGGAALMGHENMGDNGIGFFQGGAASSHGMHPSTLPALAGGPLFHSNASLQQFNDAAHHLQASLPHNPRWDPPNPLGFRASASPKLSLWVGSGPGPPPFANNQHMQNLGDHMQQHQQQQHSLLHEPAFLMQPPRGNNLSSLMESKDFALMDPMPSASKLPSSSPNSAAGAAGRLSALPPNPFFNSSFLGHVNTIMGANNNLHNPVVTDQAAVQFNSNSATRISGGGHVSMGGAASTSAMYAQEQALQQAAHGTNPQMSATALLQKAAMMGATASNPSVFRSISGQQSMSISGEQLQQSSAADERLSPASITAGHCLHNPALGSFANDPMFKEQCRSSTHSFAAEHSNSSPSPTHEQYINGMRSFAGGGQMHAYHNTANAGSMSDNPGKNNVFSSSTLTDEQRLLMNYQAFNDDHRQVMHVQLSARSLSRNPGEQEGGKPTLDFLGVGGSNHGNFLQREMPTFMSLGAHAAVGGAEFLSSSSGNDPKDPLLCHQDGNSHMGSNSSDKSADSS